MKYTTSDKEQMDLQQWLCHVNMLIVASSVDTFYLAQPVEDITTTRLLIKPRVA